MAERLTDRQIAALKYTGNGKSSDYHFDSEAPGLALRIYPSGLKSLIFDWREPNGRQRRKVLGRHPAWTIGKARTHASKLRLRADVGENIAPQRGGRVADLAEQWRSVVDLTRRKRTARGYGQHLDHYIIPAFGKGEPKAISANAVEAWHAEIARDRPGSANRAASTLSAFCSWLERDGLIDKNPCRGLRRRPENPREHYLDQREIEAAHAAFETDLDRRAGLALRFALFTGARIGEVLNLEAKQFDFKRGIWVKPSSHTKQKKSHISPLPKPAIPVARELLKLGLPDYPACRRCWRRTKKKIALRADTRIHDLRHSHASALARNGASLPMIGKLLGHSAPATTQRYLHLVDADLRDLVERTA